MWLYDAGIINFCHKLAALELPMEGNSKSDEFKVYMRDTGLLIAMLEDGTGKDIISGDKIINSTLYFCQCFSKKYFINS